MGKRKIAAPQSLTVKKFLDGLDNLSFSHRRYDNFRQFMEAAFCAIAKQNEPDNEKAAALEARYMKVVSYYGGSSRTMSSMATLLGETIMAIEDYSGDFLGEAYMFGELGNASAGQFFTPYHVSRAMAEMTLNNETIDAAIAEDRPLTVMDPACGAGCMIIAAADVLKSRGYDPADVMLATLVDVDVLCVQMSYLQLVARGVPAICVHGNSLSLEEWGRYYTPAATRQFHRPSARPMSLPAMTESPLARLVTEMVAAEA